MPWALLLLAGSGGRWKRGVPRVIGLGIAAWLLSSLFGSLLTDQTGETFPKELYARLPMLAGAVAALLLWGQANLSPKREARPADGTPPCSPSLIAFARSAGNYVELVVGGRVIFWRRTMREAERALAPHGFVRVHRSFLVSPSRVVRLRRHDNRLLVVLRSGEELPVSRPYRESAAATFKELE